MIRRGLLILLFATAWQTAACSDAEPGSGTPAEAPVENDAAPEPVFDAFVGPGADASPGPVDDALIVPMEDAVIAPVITELRIQTIAPDTGTASGQDQVEIIGTGFNNDTIVMFDESVADDIFVLDETRLVAITPPRIPGLVDVILIDPNTGATDRLEDGYLFYNPTTIVSVDPPTGHVLGGEPITILGSGFTFGTKVLLGGRAAISVEVIDDTTILAVSPDAAGPGTVDVHVSNELGVGTLKDGYTYFESPHVATVTPAVGLVAGGQQVAIVGGGFVEPLLVNFGSQPLENVEIEDAQHLTGVVPAASEAGSVDVVVSTSYGTKIAVDGYTYIDSTEPGDEVIILAVTPPQGPTQGGNLITVIAKGLTDSEDTSVTIGGIEAELKGVDAASHVVLVEVPEGEEGAVDVTLTNSNGEDTRYGGYTYLPFVKVYEVLPNFGPLDGGTEITLDGAGFEPGAQVRVGALPAASVVVLDAHTITAVTPPGSPGLANVTVLQGEAGDTLVGGFAYQSEMGLWVVDPPQGSQAGGTFIELQGSGYTPDSTVLVGGSSATHVTVVSPTKITCRTPPGYIGTVDVTVTSGTKGVITLPLSFTYYDPESMFGGTWGNEVDGVVNVTVLSTADGSPIPDAFVMLWTDPSTPYQGYTNQQGQITFSGPDLEGDQMVSASKPGYASTSVIEYNATNVTLYMTPTAQGQGPPPPGIPPPLFKGQVLNAGKYVPIPWGQCATKTAAPGTLCDPCAEDVDCGSPSMSCNELPNQGTHCTTHCVNNDDCPTGFMCYPLNGVPEPQCVPSAGEVTAYCNFTKTNIFAREGAGYRNYMEMPGKRVEEDFSFEFYVPIGEFAVYCWGGIEDDLLNFVPYTLGIARHVFALPGEEVEREIVLNHPLNTPMNVRLDDPPNNPTGPNFNYAFLHMDLGSDGTLEFLDHPFNYGTEELVFPAVPAGLNGDIYDATYSMLAGAFTFQSISPDNTPISMHLAQKITKVQDDTFYAYGATGWQAKSTGITNNVNDLAATAAGSFVGVGTDGLIIRNVGESWASQESGTINHLRGVFEAPTGEAIAVGVNGTTTHYDGLTWEVKPSGTLNDLEDIWMPSGTEAFAVGWYTIMHYDGTAWTKMTGNTSKNLRGVYGFAADDVWAVGGYGTVIHYDGTFWENIPTGVNFNLRSVWGSAPDDVFIAGEAGTILHWDGEVITAMEVDTTETLEAIWGAAPDDVIVVGAKGSIFRYDGTQWVDESPPGYEATFLAVAGSGGALTATGTHELLLGPFLEVPENISPAEGGTMGEDYTISWTLQDGVDPHFSYVIVEVPGMFGPVPEWTMVNDYNVNDILLPDFPNIDGTPGFAPGLKYLTIIRVYKEGFDIDNYSNQDFNNLRWNSWALDRSTFNKL
jgi:hypothetical protein